METSIESGFNSAYNIAKVTEVKEEILKDPFEKNSKVIDETISLTEILRLELFKMIQQLEKKITSGRIKDKETEKIKVEYFKTYINTINCYSNLSKGANSEYNKNDLKKFLDKDLKVDL